MTVATAVAGIVDREAAEVEAMALVRKAKMHVCVYHCFYGALLERLKLKVDWRAPTMYTDAVVIGFNPKFVLSKSWEHLVYIMLHEVTHCALGHPFRRKNRPPKRFNRAADYVTNGTLNKDPELAKMCPPDALVDARFDGMSVEQVDAILEQEEQQKQQQQQQPEQEEEQELAGAAGSMGDCCDAGASGEEPLFADEEEEEEEDEDNESEADDSDKGEEGEEEGSSASAGDDDEDEESEEEGAGEGEGEGEESDDEAGNGDAEEGAESDSNEDDDLSGGAEGEGEQQTGLDDAQRERLEREWQEAVTTAELAAGGDVDTAMRRAIKEAQQCNKDFTQHIDEFAAKCCAVESSWNRPARRFETYLPSYSQPGVKSLLLAIDTSGSMSPSDLEVAAGAAQRLVDDFNLRSCIVVYCDSAVRGIERFENGERITLENAKGGGGTRFHPPLRVALECEEQGEEIAGVVYFTDLEGTLADVEDFAHLQVLWVCTNRNQRRLEAPGGLGTVCTLWD